MNEIMTQQNQPAFLQGLKNAVAFANSAALPQLVFLKFNGKTGEWSLGQDSIPIEEGCAWAIDPSSLSTGFCAWNNSGAKLGEEMRMLSEEPIARADLEPLPGGVQWKEQMGFDLMCLEGSMEGSKARFTSSSTSGTRVLRDVFVKILEQAQSEAGVAAREQAIVPVVQLSTSSFKSQVGKIYAPVIDVVDWDTAALLDGSETRADTEPAAPAPAPKPQDTGAVSRRRRRTV